MQTIDNQTIEGLLNISGRPCVSVIIPGYGLSSGRAKNSLTMHAAVEHAKQMLREKYPDADLNRLTTRLDDMLNQAEVHSDDGTGIFVSEQTAFLARFPFPVTEKIKIDTFFDSRDLLYYRNTMIDYYVLAISKKHIRFFKGKGKKLTGIENEDFPVEYEEMYEYSRASRGNSFSYTLKEFERDKSVLQEIRLGDLLRKADKLAGNYINPELPLIIAGGCKETADYMAVTKHAKNIIGKIAGNYNSDHVLQLQEHVWEKIKIYFKEQHTLLLQNVSELSGKKMAVTGLRRVWAAANAGNALELIVEKDFERPAYISPDGSSLLLQKTDAAKDYICINNTVEKIIRMVQKKSGRITFMENEEMGHAAHIALRLRYKTTG